MTANPALGRRAWAAPGSALVAVGVALLVAGCTGGSAADPPATTTRAVTGGTTPSGGQASQPGPGGTASTYPVEPGASAQELPTLGTRRNGDWSFTLNAVRRLGPGQVVVEGSLVSHRNGSMSGFEEPGHLIRKAADGKTESSYEFSNLKLTVSGDPTQYLPVRDANGDCACTSGLFQLSQEKPYGVYTVMTAPEQAATVTVSVVGLQPFVGVAVTA